MSWIFRRPIVFLDEHDNFFVEHEDKTYGPSLYLPGVEVDFCFGDSTAEGGLATGRYRIDRVCYSLLNDGSPAIFVRLQHLHLPPLALGDVVRRVSEYIDAKR